MFSFTKFYNGHRAVEISNIDHDHVIELFFETLADLTPEPRCGLLHAAPQW